MATVDELIERINVITDDDWKLPAEDQIVHVRHTVRNMLIPLAYLMASSERRDREVRSTAIAAMLVLLTVIGDAIVHLVVH